MLRKEQIEGIQIIDIGGKDKFKNELPALKNMEGFDDIKNIGFVRDADDNVEGAFSSICTTLVNNGLSKPDKINTVREVSGRKTGIFIMPNNTYDRKWSLA